MNKRIRQLAEQAWMAERTEKDPEYKKSKNTEYLLKNMEDFHEKFAELIVKETMQVVANQLPSNQYLDVAHSVIEHFGVER